MGILWPPLTASLAAVLGLMAALWVVSLRRRDASVVDPFWGSGFVVVAWIYVATAGAGTGRSFLLPALVTLWGLRLSLHLLRRKRINGPRGIPSTTSWSPFRRCHLGCRTFRRLSWGWRFQHFGSSLCPASTFDGSTLREKPRPRRTPRRSPRRHRCTGPCPAAAVAPGGCRSRSRGCGTCRILESE